MRVKEIIKKYLKENGFDGLAGDSCGCFISDLMPCDNPSPDCSAGHKKSCLNCLSRGDCDITDISGGCIQADK